MQTINLWFHWLFSSPGYFLLGLIGAFVCFGLLGGVARPRRSDQSDDPAPDYENHVSGNQWRTQVEQHYHEWSAHQVREQHRIAGRHSSSE